MVGFRAADEGSLILRAKGAAPTRLMFGEDYVPARMCGTPIYVWGNGEVVAKRT